MGKPPMRDISPTAAATIFSTAILSSVAPALAGYTWSANGTVTAWAQAYGEPQTSQTLATGVGSITAAAGSQGFLADASGSCSSEITYNANSSIIGMVFYAHGNSGSAWGTSYSFGEFSQNFTLTTTDSATLGFQIYGSTSLSSSAVQGSYAWWSVLVDGVSYGSSSTAHSISLAAGVHQVYVSGQAHIIGGSMSGFGGSYVNATMSVTAVPAPGAAWAIASALALCGARRRRR